MLKRENINIRDPFILPVPEEKCYYMYGTTSMHKAPGLEVFRTTDLENFEEPVTIFQLPDNFWGTTLFWAPEVKKFNGYYYLTTTLMNPVTREKGTQIMRSLSPAGPFEAIVNSPATPMQWACLDGTLWWENGQAWMVFCHEWGQIVDGTIERIPLSDDLTHAVGEPVTLFHASEAPWSVEYNSEGFTGYVTDGPFLFYDRQNRLTMLWSSFNKDGYSMGLAHSDDGTLTGRWLHDPEPVISGR
jgi:GH43 family beta-xylosidase